MKWEEEFIGSRKDLAAFLNDLASRISRQTLSVDTQAVAFPDEDLEYHVKYQEEGDEGKLTVKVKWSMGT